MSWLTLESIAGQLWTRMADASLRAVVLAALAGLLIACWRKRPAAQHTVWTVVVLGMMLLPMLRPVIPAAHLPIFQPQVLSPGSTAPAPQLAPTNDVSTSAGPVNAQSGAAVVDLSWRIYAVFVYLTGLLLFALRLFLGFLMTRGLLRRARPVREELWRHYNLIADARVDVDIQESERVRVPVTLGLTAMHVILPAGWRTWPEGKLTVVLAHELAHVRRRDPLMALLAALNKCIFWFHPLAWWLERRLAVLAEQAADDAGVAAAGDAESYARLVLEVASGMKEQNRRLVWHGAAMDGPLLAQRIRRVMDPRTQKYVKRLGKAARVGLLASAGLLLWVAAAVDFQAVVRAQAPFDVGQIARIEVGPLEKPNPNCFCFFVADRTFPDPKPVTNAEEAAEMEHQLAANPEDESTRFELLRYYWKNKLYTQRIPLVLWLIDHHPESPLHQYETASISPPLYPGDPNDRNTFEDAKRRWLAQVDKHPEDAQVLLNAARVLYWHSVRGAIDLLKRAQKLDPAQKTAPLAQVYSDVLTSSVSKESSASTFYPNMAAQIRSELQASSDVALVGAVARRVLEVSRELHEDEPYDRAALKAIGTELAMHAQALEPQSQEWSDLMHGVKAPQAGSQQGPSPGSVSPVSPELMRMSGAMAAGYLINAPLPVYPPLAKTAHIEGMVVLRARIGTDGHVTELKVLSGHPMLVQAALDAVRSYIYKPVRLNGNPVAVETTVQVPFSLEDKGSDAKMETPLNVEGPASRINPPTDSPQTVNVSKAIAAGYLIESPKPVYPPLAKAARIQGIVLLKVRIGSDGRVIETKVISGHPMLVQPAMDAVKQYVYKPYILNGSQTEFVTVVEVPFSEDQS